MNKKQQKKGGKNAKFDRNRKSNSNVRYIAERRAERNKRINMEKEAKRQAWFAANKVLHGKASPHYTPAPKPEHPDPTPRWVHQWYEKTAVGRETTRQWLLGLHRRGLTAARRIEETHTQPLTRDEYIKAGLIRPVV